MSTGEPTNDSEPTIERPVLRIIKGNPSPEEIAAVTVVLSAVGADESDAKPQTNLVGGWSDPALRLRRPIQPGAGAWRASAWY
ncbi:acyl-CoA carboxylase subunit epsilon [Jatrophihabitans sp. DSM 45814]